MRNARHGLWGVRVGEASNPGPPQSMNRPRVDVAEDIIALLEHDLTHIDSDDEPLVQGGFDRNVVPRLGRRSSSIGFEDVEIESTAPAARSISLIRTSGTVPVVSRDALDPEVRQSVVPTVVDMSFDDTDEEVAMDGNRFAALSDHHSDQAENRPS